MEQLERTLEGIRNPRTRGNRPTLAAVPEAEIALIREFVVGGLVRGDAMSTAKNKISYLAMFYRELPPGTSFASMRTADVLQAFVAARGRLRPTTFQRLLSTARPFVRWLDEEGYNSTIDLAKINKVRNPKLDTETKRPSQMLGADEIKQLVLAAKNSRDRAIIAMQYEGACRPIELTSATWGDLLFDRYGAQFTTSRKTGKPRYIRLIWSAPYLLEWKNLSPGDVSENGNIFVSLHGDPTPLTTSGLYQMVVKTAKRANLSKNIFPYLFRHSRITAMLADEIPDAVVKLQCWGSLNSRMLATYAHLSQNDVDRILLTRAGIEVEAPGQTDLRPQQCPHCGARNTPIARFCEICGAGMDADAVREREEIGTELMGRFEDAEDAPEWLRKIVRAEILAERERAR